jgi:hypothetical protein
MVRFLSRHMTRANAGIACYLCRYFLFQIIGWAIFVLIIIFIWLLSSMEHATLGGMSVRSIVSSRLSGDASDYDLASVRGSLRLSHAPSSVQWIQGVPYPSGWTAEMCMQAERAEDDCRAYASGRWNRSVRLHLRAAASPAAACPTAGGGNFCAFGSPQVPLDAANKKKEGMCRFLSPIPGNLLVDTHRAWRCRPTVGPVTLLIAGSAPRDRSLWLNLVASLRGLPAVQDLASASDGCLIYGVSTAGDFVSNRVLSTELLTRGSGWLMFLVYAPSETAAAGILRSLNQSDVVTVLPHPTAAGNEESVTRKVAFLNSKSPQAEVRGASFSYQQMDKQISQFTSPCSELVDRCDVGAQKHVLEAQIFLSGLCALFSG